jgi:hypothetical protein
MSTVDQIFWPWEHIPAQIIPTHRPEPRNDLISSCTRGCVESVSAPFAPPGITRRLYVRDDGCHRTPPLVLTCKDDDTRLTAEMESMVVSATILTPLEQVTNSLIFADCTSDEDDLDPSPA